MKNLGLTCRARLRETRRREPLGDGGGYPLPFPIEAASLPISATWNVMLTFGIGAGPRPEKGRARKFS